MTFDEFLALDNKARLEYLNSAIDAGKSADDIAGEFATTRRILGEYGFFYVGKKWVFKNPSGALNAMM